MVLMKSRMLFLKNGLWMKHNFELIWIKINRTELVGEFLFKYFIHRHYFNIMGVYEQRNSTKTRMS